MPYEVFPETPSPSYSYILDHEFKTLITDFESGAEGAIEIWRFPKRTLQIVYNILQITPSERDALYEFYIKRRGRANRFWCFDFPLPDGTKRKIIDEFVAYGDGTTTTFDLHSKATDNDTTLKIYVAGVEKTKVTHYNFISGGGEGSADRIQFTAGNIPTTGQLITSDFKGRLRIKGRFDSDKLTEEMFTVLLEKIGLIIREVKN
jgi:hypothetical protein